MGYQAEKNARPKTDLITIILKKYQDFLDVFFKKDSDILLSHKKYDHKTILEKKQKHTSGNSMWTQSKKRI